MTTGLYKRVSLELSHSWPGELYLRLESHSGAVIMVAVDQEALDTIAGLGRTLAERNKV